MGVVYLAQDPLIGRHVALKTFRITYGMGDRELEQFRARFLREAQSCGILNHPNIVTIHDVVDLSQDENGTLFIAMEYVKGRDLKSVLQDGEPLELGFVLDVICQVADALDYAHARNVVHRDVKPANVILTDDKVAKITDFGIARLNSSNLTQDGQLLGTPNYMAPEQVQGHEVDHRADIFALGVMLYEMLTHQKPFRGDNLTQVTHKIVHTQPPPLEPFTIGKLPEGIDAVVARVLAKEPAERYQQAGELAVDLRHLRETLRQQQDLSETQDISHILPSKQPGKLVVEQQLVAADSSALARRTEASGTQDLSSSLPPPPPEVTGAGFARSSTPSRTGAEVIAETLHAPPSEPPASAQLSPRVMPVGSVKAPTAQPAADPGEMSGTLFDRVVPREQQRPLKRRLLVYVLAAAALIVLGIFVLIPRLTQHRPAPDAQQWSDERMDWERQFAAEMQRGRRLMERDEPGPALAVLREVRHLVETRQAAVLEEHERLQGAGTEAAAAERLEEFGSLDERVQMTRDLMAQAEWRLEELYLDELRQLVLTEQLEVARQALDGRRYGEALSAAEQILELQPGQEEALAILADVEPRLQRQRRPVPVAPPPPRVAEVLPPPPPPVRQPLPPPPTGPATLVVDFESEVRSGNVRVYLDTRLLVSESFRVGRRDPAFSLSRSFEIPAGTEGELKVYVTASGSAAKVHQLQANFLAGSQRRLVIRVDEDGNFRPRLR